MLRRRNLPLVFVLLAVCLVYANSFANSFHFDDFHTITDNPAIRQLSQMGHIFTDATAFSVLPANQTYRPVVTASLALDYALGRGYHLFWFHLSTLLWFLVLVTLLFFLFEVLLDRVRPSAVNRWLALGAAAWFGLHPAMAETVNYVIQRGDLYCTLGCVAGLFAFARWLHLRQYGFYLIPFVLAMFSKPTAAVFPVLLLLYVFFFETSTFPLKERWCISFLSALPALAATVLLLWVQAFMTPKSFSPSILSPTAYRLVQPLVWLRYVGELFLPLDLKVDTDLQPMASLNAAGMAGLLFLLGLLVAIVFSARRRKLHPICFGLLWFVLTQLPTSMYPLSEVENDHRMFFSFPGLMLATVWFLYLGWESLERRTSTEQGERRWMRWVANGVVVVCLCAYGYGAHLRNRVWRSEDTLWADDVAKAPRNGRGLMIYGLTRMNAGDLTGALGLFHRALVYTPNYATLEINLGVVSGLIAAQGDSAMNAVAEEHFQRAISLAPGDDTTHAYYGRWLLTQGNETDAIAQLETAVALNPQREMQRDLLLNAYEQAGNIAGARRLAEDTLDRMPGDAAATAVLHGGGGAGTASDLINASLAAYRAGQFQRSIERAKQALVSDPQSAEAWNNVGAGYGALREWDLGIAAERRALQLKPDLHIAQNNLRWFQAQKSGSEPRTAAEYVDRSLALNQQGRYEESIHAAQRALSLDPRSAEAWNNIAADHEARRRWDEAIAAAERAIALRPDFQLAKNNLAWAQQQKAKDANR